MKSAARLAIVAPSASREVVASFDEYMPIGGGLNVFPEEGDFGCGSIPEGGNGGSEVRVISASGQNGGAHLVLKVIGLGLRDFAKAASWIAQWFGDLDVFRDRQMIRKVVLGWTEEREHHDEPQRGNREGNEQGATKEAKDCTSPAFTNEAVDALSKEVDDHKRAQTRCWNEGKRELRGGGTRHADAEGGDTDEDGQPVPRSEGERLLVKGGGGGFHQGIFVLDAL